MVGRSMYVGVLGHDARAAVRHRGRLSFLRLQLRDRVYLQNRLFNGHLDPTSNINPISHPHHLHQNFLSNTQKTS